MRISLGLSLSIASLGLVGCPAIRVADPPFDFPDGGSPQLDVPPPISGGTLLVLPDGRTAVASDPDEDRVWIVDTRSQLVRSITLLKHDEPGRLAVDGQGTVHVVLRGGGAVIGINPEDATVVARRDVCPAPRGIAYEAGAELIHVACVGGELVSLPIAGGDAVAVRRLEPDLRDVMVVRGQLLVSTFRSAELLAVAPDGTISSRLRSGSYTPPGSQKVFTPSVAWRTLVTPSGAVAMLHQRGLASTIHVQPAPTPSLPFACDSISVGGGIGGGGSSYGGGGGGGQGIPDLGVGPGNADLGAHPASVAADPCTDTGAVVHSTVTLFDAGAGVTQGPFHDLTLPVDLAISADGQWYAAASPAHSEGIPSTHVLFFPASNLPAAGASCTSGGHSILAPSQAVAVAALAGTRFVVQSRAPSSLAIVDAVSGQQQLRINLSGADTGAPGHDRFHVDTGIGLACASCHPEAGDDGRVWSFDSGRRRTMSLRGGLRGTEPFHWSGDESDFTSLMTDVFMSRMGGSLSCQSQVDEVGDWLEGLPNIAPSVPDSDAAVRGLALFADPSVGCSGCHDGPHLTNNQTLDVGTGGAFQVPRLHGVGNRPPYLHDGCAKTLTDRFGPCGGGDRHGHTSQLDAAQIADLVAYLQSL